MRGLGGAFSVRGRANAFEELTIAGSLGRRVRNQETGRRFGSSRSVVALRATISTLYIPVWTSAKRALYLEQALTNSSAGREAKRRLLCHQTF